MFYSFRIHFHCVQECPMVFFWVPCNKVLQVWDHVIWRWANNKIIFILWELSLQSKQTLPLATNLWLSHIPLGCAEVEQSTTRAHTSHPEIRITHYISEGSLLSPVLEQEGEVYLERVGTLRRHSVTNAHSDIQLLTATSRMYSGMDDSCETIDWLEEHISEICHVMKASMGTKKSTGKTGNKTLTIIYKSLCTKHWIFWWKKEHNTKKDLSDFQCQYNYQLAYISLSD